MTNRPISTIDVSIDLNSGKIYFDGIYPTVPLKFEYGGKYRFSQTHSSNIGLPLSFYTTQTNLGVLYPNSTDSNKLNIDSPDKDTENHAKVERFLYNDSGELSTTASTLDEYIKGLAGNGGVIEVTFHKSDTTGIPNIFYAAHPKSENPSRVGILSLVNRTARISEGDYAWLELSVADTQNISPIEVIAKRCVFTIDLIHDKGVTFWLT